MGKKAPKAPDPVATAQAQYQYSTKSAQDNLKMNALGQTGPTGSSTFTKDANGNPTGIVQSLTPTLAAGGTNVQNAYKDTTGQLPTQPINWDSTTPQNIFDSAQTAYHSYTDPLRAQEDNRFIESMKNQGIPIDSEIWNNQRHNTEAARGIADASAASQAWASLPGYQSQLTQNQITQHDQPLNYSTGLANNLGLLNSLVPKAAQPTANAAAPDYSQLVQNKYNADMQAYQNKQSGIGQLIGTGLGLLTAPLTGGLGLSNSLLGMGASKLFNGGGYTGSLSN